MPNDLYNIILEFDIEAENPDKAVEKMHYIFESIEPTIRNIPDAVGSFAVATNNNCDILATTNKRYKYNL